MDYEWEQYRTIHCPKPECNGMLLESKFKHELKCSDCQTEFMECTTFVEVKRDHK